MAINFSSITGATLISLGLYVAIGDLEEKFSVLYEVKVNEARERCIALNAAKRIPDTDVSALNDCIKKYKKGEPAQDGKEEIVGIDETFGQALEAIRSLKNLAEAASAAAAASAAFE